MHATAGHCHDAIAGLHPRWVDQFVFFHHGHAEARQVVAAGAIEARHFSRFTAQQGTTALAAAIGDALHHLSHRLRGELAGGDVIEKEQGLGATGDHVVDAHRHQINAHPVVLAMGLSQLQLGAHTIGPRHQQRLAHALGQATKPTETT